jgi:DNA-directed RNA polymerase subunit M
MNFCLNCGSRLEPRKVKSKNQAILVFACNKCGHKQKETNKNMEINGKTIEHSPKQLVSVIGKEDQLNILPTIQVTCPKCDNGKVYAWQVQTKRTDESSTQFLRCTKCNYTFREDT